MLGERSGKGNSVTTNGRHYQGKADGQRPSLRCVSVTTETNRRWSIELR